MADLTCIESLQRRLAKLGVEVTYTANLPWIYLETVNGVRVREKFWGEHGFTVCFYPIRPGQTAQLTDTKKIFAVIRKYCKSSHSLTETRRK